LEIPIVYNNNRRAILAIDKGTLGERAFADAFAAPFTVRAMPPSVSLLRTNPLTGSGGTDALLPDRLAIMMATAPAWALSRLALLSLDRRVGLRHRSVRSCPCACLGGAGSAAGFAVPSMTFAASLA
jgi:hypothetical protein